ncbi:MAG: hypothetical protein JWM88_2937, partial [Verrucomicrobia bacterium]|nr:hypothetical protein [Verrucomicrobiota bacterium]
GKDLVFTYGPLGHLLAATNRGAHYGEFLLWQGVSAAFFATVVWLLGRSFRGWSLAFYYAYFLCFAANYVDAMHMTIILVLGLAPLRETIARRRWLVALAGIALAVLGLMKFTNLMLAGFAVACVSAHHLHRRRWPDLAVTAGSFVGAFLAGWLLCRQQLGNLPAYLRYSLNATGGYGEGMSIYEDNLTLFIGAAAGLSVAGYFLLTLWRRQDFPRALAVALIVAAGSFMNWKHGFTRADGHVFAHYIACLLVPVTFPVLMMDDGPLRRWKTALLWSTTGFSLWGIMLCAGSAITDAAAMWNYQLKGNVAAVARLPKLAEEAREDFAKVAEPHVMPGIRTVVGKDTIDMLGNDQAYILFNRFNYTPRPVFQTYLPYTAELMRLNEAFFKSPRAPHYVLQKFDPIDFRLPPLEDSLTSNYLYHHYSYVMEERGMLLWHQNDTDPARDQRTPIGTATGHFGQRIAVPAQGESPVWVEFDVRPSLLGRLRAFLYKAPILMMSADEGGGSDNSYRVIRSMAGAGFMAYPHFTSGYNVQRFMGGDAPPRLRGFTLRLLADQLKYFQPDVAVRFFALQPLTRAKGIVAGSPEEKFRVFDRMPAVANSLYPLSILVEGNREVLFAHPPSNIEFHVDFPASWVTGVFGLAAKSYEAPNATDGAEFIVEWVGADGKVATLFSRLLQPVTERRDRGFQTFNLPVPRGGGRLILRTTPGPNGNIAFDWTFWTDVRFVP